MKKTKRSDRPQKFIRVNNYTVIQTDYDTPDEVVRDRYNSRQSKNFESLHNPPRGINYFR
jgi:hypothetical protein